MDVVQYSSAHNDETKRNNSCVHEGNPGLVLSTLD